MNLYNITINNSYKTIIANTYACKSHREASIFAYGMFKGLQSGGVEVKGWTVKKLKTD